MYKVDKWKIIEEGFDPLVQRGSESIFSIGNGRMGQRANFEENYSGDSLQGSYIGGIYYPDKTKVGWWKIGYPEYYAKVINSVNWIGIDVQVNGETLDLSKCDVLSFRRTLDMRKGLLQRSFKARLSNGNEVKVQACRFISMKRSEVGAVEFTIEPLNFSGSVTLTPYLNGNVRNEDSNYEEIFWEEINQAAEEKSGYVVTKTKKLDFHVCAAMQSLVKKNGREIQAPAEPSVSSLYSENCYKVDVNSGDQISLYKYVVIASSLNHERKRLHDHAVQSVQKVAATGFKTLRNEQESSWTEIWKTCDIKIWGDEAAQQGIRFNIFQLYQTYTGEDPRLNIGPKGFTGEKYGGVTYWDTEGYCLPFYLCTAGQQVAKNLLLYRYRHLQKAIENAEKLGFTGGAALYPMVTANGEECHNEWEITFEEIHRNGAIAYAIFNYIRHTGDTRYLIEGGLEVLVAISRFWSQRFHFSEHRKKYVMLGVTGPNEYENNVDNNWYTSYIACWTLRYTFECLEITRAENPDHFDKVMQKVDFSSSEKERWRDLIDRVYLPEDEERGIVLQQDGYLDKKQRMASELNASERPINQHWSWDRILRSCFIKQGDVIQGLYFFEHEFSEDMIRRNFDYYEPRTVHESSLSPCIHSILASSLGYAEIAYKLYLRTARLDLDDYNKEVYQGLHITSMAGTWMTIVEGFAEKRVKNGALHLSPNLPPAWKGYSFNIWFRERLLHIHINEEQIRVECGEGEPLQIFIFNESFEVSVDAPAEISRKSSESING